MILLKLLTKTEDSITISYCKKLKVLGIFETSNTRIKVDNLNSKTLDQKLNKILDKGPMFVFAANKYNEKEDQIEAEYLYNQISEISKNHYCSGNMKRFSEDFEVVCKSYIWKQKLHDQKTQWETIKTFCNKDRVVVTKSDKGNSIVVLDDSTYYTKGYQFFNDQNFFKSLNDNEKNTHY